MLEEMAWPQFLGAGGFKLKPTSEPEIERVAANGRGHQTTQRRLRIAIVGKYTVLKDAYKSLMEALAHGGISHGVRVNIQWLDAELFEKGDPSAHLENIHGIIVPGGFGERGAEGKIEAARDARTRKVPYLGICFGMQLAVIEVARHVAGIKGANSTEFGPAAEPVVGLMTEWMSGATPVHRDAQSEKGGTMRLGADQAVLAEGSQVC